MRLILAALLMGLAVWQAVRDWQETIGLGYAYRLKSVGQMLAEAAPQRYEALISVWKNTTIPFLWDPIGMILMGMPLALLLAGIALILWISGRRKV